MATLNHTNLTTYNVPELKEFFSSVFGFQIINERGDKLAVLRNSVLTPSQWCVLLWGSFIHFARASPLSSMRTTSNS